MRWLLAIPMAVALLSVPAEGGGCAGSSTWSGGCTVENTGSTVEIGATQPGGSDVSNPRTGGGGGGLPDATAPAPCVGSTLVCDRIPITYAVEVIQPTLADVASFAPASVPLLDEPDGVGVVGMPVNFVVTPTVHEQAGELFALPISVRFTPASIVFVHGDGTSRTATGGGRTWEQLGLPQFSATTTSHAYAARGTYSAHAIVRYAAEYNLGRGWAPIDGLLEIPTAAAALQIVEVRTALVDQTCLENPSGPGC